MTSKVLFTCEYCSNHFKTERGFTRHHCDKMQREEDFKSITGQAALNYYNTWMVLKHKSTALASDSFKTSAYFTSFVKFYEFNKRTNLPSVQKYIELMVRKKIDPKFWCLPDAYRLYLEYIAYQLPLNEHINITIKTLFDCADAASVDISNVFEVLCPKDIIQLLRQRKLSPWLLLKSKKFANFVINKTSNEERLILQTVIKPDYWAKKYKSKPNDTIQIKKYISEMGI